MHKKLISDTATTKERGALRRTLRAKRRGLSKAQRHHRSLRLARAAAKTILLRRARSFACFLSADGEVDTHPLIARVRARLGQIWLPCLGQAKLRFRRFDAATKLRKGEFGMLEPASGRMRDILSLDVVFMPLVAFDDQGNRLGMGGGYYDRSLAILRGRCRYRRPLLIGIAFDLQQVAALRTCAWDIPLHGVLTESGLTRFKRRQRS